MANKDCLIYIHFDAGLAAVLPHGPQWISSGLHKFLVPNNRGYSEDDISKERAMCEYDAFLAAVSASS